MGQWNLLPADSNGAWHSLETSKYFKKIFGFGKGTFIIQTLDDDMQHCYFPQFYVDKIYNYIRKTNEQDYKKLAKILSGFYKLRRECKKSVPRTSKTNLKQLSNRKLIKTYKLNRDWAHRVTPYDQFGWVAEDYWNPILEKILAQHGLKKGSSEYFRAFFSLTKPAEISTTLKEKRGVLKYAIMIKRKNASVDTAAKALSREFGWMPVFAFGTPWDEEHYLQELKNAYKQKLGFLQSEYESLKNYTKVQKKDFQEIQKKYRFATKDLQKFIDFGLVLDARNEAEYVLSYCSLYLLPIYDEIARRLYISVKQLRNLVKKDIIRCLEGKADPQKIFDKQGKILGWIFDKSMMHVKYLDEREAKNFFDYLNKTSKNLQGNDEAKGVCASPGKARGQAKIVLYPKEGDKVKSGDILIAHATTVDYSLAMKKSAAFVTEVGGLMCHAAVVAREFGVPCVVGLKNATKNFKDGDLVEVDAEKGIVKKISNSKLPISKL
jgi:phosphohistidine swiveling domain-containing protein